MMPDEPPTFVVLPDEDTVMPVPSPTRCEPSALVVIPEEPPTLEEPSAFTSLGQSRGHDRNFGSGRRVLPVIPVLSLLKFRSKTPRGRAIACKPVAAVRRRRRNFILSWIMDS